MVQAQTTTIPYNGSGTVNIHINNPSASLTGGMPYYYPYPVYPCYCYPPNYYCNIPTQTTQVSTPGKQQSAQTPPNLNAVQKPPEKKENVKKHEIIVLTDNYIKNLENHLRNNNIALRQNAIKEILQRFKEDKSRTENPSLTALLNLALQDTNSVVRSTAMSIIQAGYAKGDKQTEELLKQLQQSKDNFSIGASQATDSLMQMSKTKALVPDNSHVPNSIKEEKKGT